MKTKDTILCNSKREAIEVIDTLDSRDIDDWEFMPDGKVLIKLNCSAGELKERRR